MITVTLSLGSNRQAEAHITAALDALDDRLTDLRLSRVFESEAVGFDGDNFLNMVVRADTSLTLADLSGWLKALEEQYGRDRQQARFSSRTLDVDVLTFDGLQGRHEGMVLPRPEITRNAFVLWPMAEVYGEGVDPDTGKSYARLWQEYDRSRQRLWPISFQWRGRTVSLP